MDLALLVYGISLLNKIEGLLIFTLIISVIAVFAAGIGVMSWKLSSSEYSWDLNRDGTVKQKVLEGRRTVENILKYSVITTIVAAIVMLIIPNEKTAYTMAGAYAAQKVVENDKVQDMSGKVLQIINQKLDTYIDDGVKQAEKKIKDDKK